MGPSLFTLETLTRWHAWQAASSHVKRGKDTHGTTSSHVNRGKDSTAQGPPRWAWRPPVLASFAAGTSTYIVLLEVQTRQRAARRGDLGLVRTPPVPRAGGASALAPPRQSLFKGDAEKDERTGKRRAWGIARAVAGRHRTSTPGARRGGGRRGRSRPLWVLGCVFTQ